MTCTRSCIDLTAHAHAHTHSHTHAHIRMHTHTHTHTRTCTHTRTEFNNLHLSDSGDGDTLGPLPHGNMWGSSDGEFSVHYDYGYHGRPGGAGGGLSASSKSNSPSPGMVGMFRVTFIFSILDTIETNRGVLFQGFRINITSNLARFSYFCVYVGA